MINSLSTTGWWEVAGSLLHIAFTKKINFSMFIFFHTKYKYFCIILILCQLTKLLHYFSTACQETIGITLKD